MTEAAGGPGSGPGAIERPALGNEPGDYWGSDAVALMLREIDIPYVALNPGASYRGLHDSLVNLLGNRDPQMLLCLHEEHAVAIAHGYAKVTGKAMGAAVHSNVGLFHATMAISNAWCDRMPILILGATGPVAPITMTGMRSHQALKIAMVAWNRPTLEWTAAAMARPVTLA